MFAALLRFSLCLQTYTQIATHIITRILHNVIFEFSITFLASHRHRTLIYLTLPLRSTLPYQTHLLRSTLSNLSVQPVQLIEPIKAPY